MKSQKGKLLANRLGRTSQQGVSRVAWVLIVFGGFLLVGAIISGAFLLGREAKTIEIKAKDVPAVGYYKKELEGRQVDLNNDGIDEYVRVSRSDQSNREGVDVTLEVFNRRSDDNKWEPAGIQFLVSYAKDKKDQLGEFVQLGLLPDLTRNNIDEIVTVVKSEKEEEKTVVEIWSYDPESKAVKLAVIWDKKVETGPINIKKKGVEIIEEGQINLYTWNGRTFTIGGLGDMAGSSNPIDMEIAENRAIEIAKQYVKNVETEMPLDSEPDQAEASEMEVVFDPITGEYIMLVEAPPKEIMDRYEKHRGWLVQLVYQRTDIQQDFKVIMEVDATNGRIGNYKAGL